MHVRAPYMYKHSQDTGPPNNSRRPTHRAAGVAGAGHYVPQSHSELFDTRIVSDFCDACYLIHGYILYFRLVLELVDVLSAWFTAIMASPTYQKPNTKEITVPAIMVLRRS